MDFRSDNTARAADSVLAAIAAANRGPASAYGDDPWTDAAKAALQRLFAATPEIIFVPTGTAANALALAPGGAILCHREAHIETDEGGAPEFFTGGAKLVLIDGADAKITPEGLKEALTRNRRGVHSVRPSVLSLTQASERGAVYTPSEIAALAEIAHAAGLAVHMDGARFANAVAHLGCAPADIAQRAGVDVLSFGATKNGALAAEAVLAFARVDGDALARRRKRAGHLISKHRYIAAQWSAYLEDDLWLKNATRANGLAARIAEAAGDWLSSTRQSNHVFIKPGPEKLAALRAAGAQFYDWGPEGSGEARLVVSWDQDERDLDALCSALTTLRR